MDKTKKATLITGATSGIGEGAVVAGAVVSKDVAPRAIADGVPVKFINNV